jgi:vacuolar-type H+-ATPase catalytic subunit A/Vma1
MPDPIEIVDLVKSTGIDYDNSLLNKPENTEKYNSEHKMALNMGVYTVDLGYTNLHNKTQDAIKYLDATKKMTNGLKVSQFFDFEKIKSITQEGKDLNQLITTTGIGLDKMRQGLEDEKRGEAITLIVAGGWLEAVYLATQVAEKVDRKEKIADQKIVITELIKMFEANKTTSKHLTEIYEDFKKINDAFTNIAVKNEEGKEVQVQMSKEDFNKLNQTIKEVRNKIIS